MKLSTPEHEWTRRIFCKKALIAAFAGLFLLGAGSVSADDWSSYQHDPAHTGYSSAVINPTALTLAWSPSDAYATPLIVGDDVFATYNGFGTNRPTKISSFDLASGAINWTYSATFLNPSQAAVGGGFVVFSGTTGGPSSTQLYVLDQNTGQLRYSVPVPEGNGGVIPTIVQNPTTGAVTAYVADGSHVSAVSLQANSGAIAWTGVGSFGGSSIPTVVGNSVVMAGPGQFYAFDRTTGAANHFHDGGVAGGGGTTVAYDSSRQQFYVIEDFDGNGPALTAYRYGGDNNSITQLWQRTGTGIARLGSVAIGANGNIYSAANGGVWELDPQTGATLRTISRGFATGITPIISSNVLWVYDEFDVFAYDLLTLHLLRSFRGSRGSSNGTYDGPGAISDGYFILDEGPTSGRGFHVYSQVPEPSTVFLLVMSIAGAAVSSAHRKGLRKG